MSARSQLQSKPVADLRSIAESLGIEHKGLQKAKLIDLLVEHSDDILESIEEETPEVISTSKDDDAPAVVSSGSSEIKKGEIREGILDTLPEGYGFLRCNGYKPSEEDVYVAAGVIKKYRMRKGDLVSGPIRAPRQKEKYPALIEPKTVNGADPELLARRVDFNKLTPLFPDERLKLEIDGSPQKILPRIVDLIAPIGKGQRGLIVSPPKAGKTTILKEIANSITTNNPEVYLMVVLVDERPEEVTDMQRSVDGEVVFSTFDRPPDEHTQVSKLAIERAKRLVEEGKDVVILLDSITRLARAHNLATPASGRILSGGVDSTALTPPKQFFGAARNIEGGGSLTILGTALVETGSKMDEVIFEEFKGTGNMELRLDRQLADKRVFPAIDVTPSGTREEQRLVEEGKDVVILLDSITRLARAHNLATPASGRILSGGVDSTALTPPKQFFGAARNIEGGGSLTILGTALVETGSKMDEVIFEEFKGTGNMELRLDRQLADKRVFPAIDVTPSGTREEQRLVSPKELESLWALRRVLVALEGGAATELLIDKLKETKSNDAFLKDVAKAK